MARILRGEIRWADLNPIRGREQAGLRPVLILSHDVFNERSGTVIAVALTSQPQRAGFPLTHELNLRSWPNVRGSKSARFEPFPLSASAQARRSTPEELALVVEGLNEIIGI